MTAPGWYNAEGDPPGTTRYWDGSSWIGDPVHTPPAVQGGGVGPGQVNLASPGSRIGARLIDFIISLLLGLIFLVPLLIGAFDDLDSLGPNPSDAQVERIFTDAFQDNIGVLLAFGVLAMFWDFIWVGLFGGTPGKLMVGIRVGRSDNGAYPPGWGKAALRALNRIVAFVPIVGGLIALLVGLVSLIMLFTDDKHRTVMDRVASTVVVRK